MSCGRAWTFKEDQLLKRRWIAGITMRAIADEVGRHRDTVRNRLRFLGLTYDPTMRNKCAWTPEADARLAAMWSDFSQSAEKIANRMGATTRAVKSRAAALGLTRRTAPAFAKWRRGLDVDVELVPEPEIELAEQHAIICRNAGGFTSFTETWAGRGVVPQSLSRSKDWRLGPVEPALRRAA